MQARGAARDLGVRRASVQSGSLQITQSNGPGVVQALRPHQGALLDLSVSLRFAQIRNGRVVVGGFDPCQHVTGLHQMPWLGHDLSGPSRQRAEHPHGVVFVKGDPGGNGIHHRRHLSRDRLDVQIRQLRRPWRVPQLISGHAGRGGHRHTGFSLCMTPGCHIPQRGAHADDAGQIG